MEHDTGFHITCTNALLSWQMPWKETPFSVFMWMGDLLQPNCSNDNSNIEVFLWEVSSIICIIRWDVYKVKISVIFHEMK